ncbi:MAG TPA: homoserine kinase [Candidatus Latescibacteria bacterium]|nr:homoserine kinase [Candidatus Latescibacterota bacterium]HOF60696.1 homoserine kinase [Candidatus Latescibacterota bacterium]HOS63602.1 homoserine kinase [Candidatus Latescibacterota bacterium]HPK73352.1 homoserine kinase [Candidatus Latescibacterota bacterium]
MGKRPQGWSIRVPATTANLGPGFDCFGLALQRYLNLFVTVRGEKGAWHITLHGEGAGILPRDRTNLIYRALVLGSEVDAESLPGIAIRMENAIPLARGQGSSAAAIVAGMAAAQLLTTGKIDPDQLINRATLVEGHSDNVAAAVKGGLVLTRESPSGVAIRPIPTRDGALFVSAVPEFELTTHTSRSVLPQQVPLGDAVFNLRAAAWMASAWAAGDWEAVGNAMEDRLHQPYRAPLIPGFDDVCRAARAAGALGACLSGSGPAIVALALHSSDAVARAMEQAWAKHGITSRAEVTHVDTDGLTIAPLEA